MALWIPSSNYTRLMNSMTKEIPDDVPDANHFLWFLKSLKLTLENADFSQ